MEAAANAIRGCIVAPEGKKLCVSDLSNIEGRALAWLAGEAWKVNAFRAFDGGEGHDIYKLAYARSFKVDPGEVTKDQRQIGKVQELALGYQGAVGAFQTMAAIYGVALPEEEVLAIVKAWRKAHPEIRSWWYDLEGTAKACIRQQGVTLACRSVKMRRDGAWLRVALPGGRALCYPQPKLVGGGRCHECEGRGHVFDEPCEACRGRGVLPERITYAGVNPYTRQWTRIDTYGGKLAENITQAVARDVLAEAMPRVETAGYEIVLTVHDELITEAPDTDDYSDSALSALLATPPAWAPDLPLAAGGFSAYRYRKD